VDKRNGVNEPSRLSRGKIFQALVQKDFRQNTHDGTAHAEARLSFERLPHLRQKFGRADILITDLGGFVTVLEIKATDWDKIEPANVKRNLYRHQRQLFMYVEKCLEVDKLDVCLGIIYPHPPRKPGLRSSVENHLESQYGVPAYWYSEIRTGAPKQDA